VLKRWRRTARQATWQSDEDEEQPMAERGTDEERRPSPAEIEAERASLQERISDWLDIPLAVLALIWTVLFVVELAVQLPPETSARLLQADFAIWAVFAFVFVFEFMLAPDKARYLRTNALAAVSVVLPFARVVRVAKLARLVRSVSLVRIALIANRATSGIAELFSTHQFQYLLAVAAVVTVLGGAGASYFERDVPDSPFANFWEALWWATTVVTTINVGIEPTTVEGRIIGLLLRVFGLGVFGYLAGSIASFLVGRRTGGAEARAVARSDVERLAREVERLRATMDRLQIGERPPERNEDEADAP
jgi:voltage-gated potassium channel